MWKKMLLLPLALLLLCSSALHVCYEVSVNGHMLPGYYSRRQLERCTGAAAAASEEILRGKYAEPLIGRSCRLRLQRPEGDCRLLTHLILLSTDGIVSADGVFANGIPLGTVASGESLFERLRDYIKNQMPNAAVMGSISGELSICPVYSFPGHETPYEDMLLLISGITPVFYVDSDGRLA